MKWTIVYLNYLWRILKSPEFLLLNVFLNVSILVYVTIRSVTIYGLSGPQLEMNDLRQRQSARHQMDASKMTHAKDDKTPYIDMDKLIDSRSLNKTTDAFIVGVKECIPNGFMSILSHHPQLVLANGPTSFFRHDSYYWLGKQYYTSIIPDKRNGTITLDSCVECFDNPFAPKRLFEMNRDLKVIVMLRNPVERLLLEYSKLIQTEQRHINLTLDGWLFDPDTGEVHTNRDSIKRSAYMEFLPKWSAAFGRDNIHLISVNAFLKNPWMELGNLERFLHIDTFFEQQKHDPIVRTKGFTAFCHVPGVCVMDSTAYLQYATHNTTNLLNDYYKDDNRRLNQYFNICFDEDKCKI
ncbi:unnamed protein product [Owenia fusiformis]|uniref:Uncharacterized protein n=1 Tax=Owenia fusiformis TaxID=6347 RepID=A0A8J1Y158_OWEFU|nr:unnamed protein product [Owenia fusiformis]